MNETSTSIPKPDRQRMVQEATLTALTVNVDERHVVYAYGDAGITLSIATASAGDWTSRLGEALRQRRIIGDLAVRTRVSCGGGAEAITTHGYPSDVVAVRAAIPHLYAGLRNPDERAALRAIYRHLTQLADRPACDLSAITRMERGASLDDVAADWLMTPDALRGALTVWADEQRRFGHMNDERHEAVTARIHAVERSA